LPASSEPIHKRRWRLMDESSVIVGLDVHKKARAVRV
jgi:hypothetical protein